MSELSDFHQSAKASTDPASNEAAQTDGNNPIVTIRIKDPLQKISTVWTIPADSIPTLLAAIRADIDEAKKAQEKESPKALETSPRQHKNWVTGLISDGLSLIKGIGTGEYLNKPMPKTATGAVLTGVSLLIASAAAHFSPFDEHDQSHSGDGGLTLTIKDISDTGSIAAALTTVDASFKEVTNAAGENLEAGIKAAKDFQFIGVAGASSLSDTEYLYFQDSINGTKYYYRYVIKPNEKAANADLQILDGDSYRDIKSKDPQNEYSLWQDGSDYVVREKVVATGKELIWKPDPDKEGEKVTASDKMTTGWWVNEYSKNTNDDDDEEESNVYNAKDLDGSLRLRGENTTIKGDSPDSIIFSGHFNTFGSNIEVTGTGSFSRTEVLGDSGNETFDSKGNKGNEYLTTKIGRNFSFDYCTIEACTIQNVDAKASTFKRGSQTGIKDGPVITIEDSTVSEGSVVKGTLSKTVLGKNSTVETNASVIDTHTLSNFLAAKGSHIEKLGALEGHPAAGKNIKVLEAASVIRVKASDDVTFGKNSSATDCECYKGFSLGEKSKASNCYFTAENISVGPDLTLEDWVVTDKDVKITKENFKKMKDKYGPSPARTVKMAISNFIDYLIPG